MKQDRRKFISSLCVATALPILSTPVFGCKENTASPPNINHIGPQAGYSPQIGSLVSMLDWISNSVSVYHRGLSVEQLDYVFDDEANSIGSMMMHVAATEVMYQDITFYDLNDFSKENKEKWGMAMSLGKNARKNLKGNSLDFYKDAFQEVRETTKRELKDRDDEWLLSGETEEWNWNNYCKWFHVVEHYANHRGQMTWIMKRLPKNLK